jgi:predicted DNA-binding transcriptional regulator AlpA
MSDTAKNPFDVLLDAFRQVVREEISALKTEINGQDRLLDAEEAAGLLCVSEDWLYRHAKRLPFARKLAPKMLRFSYVGIVKWLATRKPAN